MPNRFVFPGAFCIMCAIVKEMSMEFRTLSFGLMAAALTFGACGQSGGEKEEQQSNVSVDDNIEAPGEGTSEPNTDEETASGTDETADDLDPSESDPTSDTGDGPKDTTPEDLCGNHVLDEGEKCELDFQTYCVDLSPDFKGGMADCKKDCTDWDLSTCEKETAFCGDGTVDKDEKCDGNVRCSDLGGGFNRGTAVCADDCSGYDTSDCSTCGDGVVGGNERCDSDEKACTAVSSAYSSGQAVCRGDCGGYDVSGCTSDYDIDIFSSVPATFVSVVGDVELRGNGIAANGAHVHLAGAATFKKPGSSYYTNDFIHASATSEGTSLSLVQDGTSFIDIGMAMDADPGGNIYLAGNTYGTIAEGGEGLGDVFVVKKDPKGNELWRAQWGTMDEEYIFDIAVSPKGEIYLAGRSGAMGVGIFETMIVKLDNAGNYEWHDVIDCSASYGDCLSQAESVTLDKNGNVWVAGLEEVGSSKFGGFNFDFFVASYSPKGKRLLHKTYGSKPNGIEEYDLATGIAVDDDNVVWVTGMTWGNLYGTNNNDSADSFVASFKQDGSLIFGKQFGSSLFDQPEAIVIHKNDIYIAGQTEGGVGGFQPVKNGDIFVTKLDKSLNEKWSILAGTEYADWASDLKVDPSGRLCVGGTYRSPFFVQDPTLDLDILDKAFMLIVTP